MKPEQALALRRILTGQRIGALGTLHKGQPFVSMVPFALLPDGSGLVIHVSELATHTRDMRLNPAVSLMVVEPPGPNDLPQAAPRATVQALAVQCLADAPGYSAARQAYLARFAHSAELFGFADFSLFVLQPQSLRFVGGFAQATSVMPSELARVLRGD